MLQYSISCMQAVQIEIQIKFIHLNSCPASFKSEFQVNHLAQNLRMTWFLFFKQKTSTHLESDPCRHKIRHVLSTQIHALLQHQGPRRVMPFCKDHMVLAMRSVGGLRLAIPDWLVVEATHQKNITVVKMASSSPIFGVKIK